MIQSFKKGSTVIPATTLVPHEIVALSSAYWHELGIREKKTHLFDYWLHALLDLKEISFRPLNCIHFVD